MFYDCPWKISKFNFAANTLNPVGNVVDFIWSFFLSVAKLLGFGCRPLEKSNRVFSRLLCIGPMWQYICTVCFPVQK